MEIFNLIILNQPEQLGHQPYPPQHHISGHYFNLISVIIIFIVVDAESKHNEISSDQVKEGLRLGIVRLGKAGGKVAIC